MKRIIAVLLVLILIAFGGCKEEKTIKMPFGPEDRISENYEKVVNELKRAGFTKVSADPVNTAHKARVGQVDSITVNGDTFKKSQSFPENAVVIVKYYKLVDKAGESGGNINFFK